MDVQATFNLIFFFKRERRTMTFLHLSVMEKLMLILINKKCFKKHLENKMIFKSYN